MASSVADEEPDRERLTSSIVSVGVCVNPVADGTTSSVVTVEPLEDGMGASVEAVDWNVEGITSSIVDASACSAG